MKYVCLVHFVPGVLSALSAEEKRRLDIDSIEYDQALQARGSLIQAQALQSPETAVLVKVRDGNIATTDGPYAETKEHLGGFILIEARDLNDAIRVAAGIPLARLGTIEVRPIYELTAPENDPR